MRNSQEDPHLEARRLVAFSTVLSVRLLFTHANILEQLYGCESPLYVYVNRKDHKSLHCYRKEDLYRK
jgi:hypothetical protein